MRPTSKLNWLGLCFGLVTISVTAGRGDDVAIRDAVTFYVSFDAGIDADFARGAKSPSTRSDDPKERGRYIYEAGVPRDAFQIVPEAGVHGGALKVTDVLPRRGRIYYPARENIAFQAGGWSGSASLWIRTDPNTLLKTPFCDPVQLTQRGASDGGLWIDFPDVKPRDLRLGVFSALQPGQKPLAESDPKAPLVTVKNVAFRADEWHHLAIAWRNFDTGRNDATATLYVDGRKVGSLSERAITMGWELDQAGIYVAVNYVGLLDEFSLFNRALGDDEIARLHAQPGLLQKK